MNIKSYILDNPQLLEKCTPRQRKILSLRLGLPPYKTPRTLKYTGNFCYLSAERVRQIEKDALERIKSHLESNLQSLATFS